MSRFKYFVLILISLAFLSCSNKEKPEKLSSMQWKIFSYLPEESHIISFIDLNRLRENENWEKFLKPRLIENKNFTWLKDIENKTGIGLKKGVSQVYATVELSGNNSSIVVFDKKFKSLKKYFNNDRKFIKTKLNNNLVYKLKSNSLLNFLFINDSDLLISTNFNYITEFTKGKYNSLAQNQSLIGVIDRIRYKSQYWVASDKGDYISELIERLLNKHQDVRLNKLLNSIHEVSLCVKFSDGIDLRSNLDCSSFGNAHLLAVALSSGISMDLFSQGNEQISRLIHKLKIENTGKEINLKLALNKNELENLKQPVMNYELFKYL